MVPGFLSATLQLGEDAEFAVAPGSFDEGSRVAQVTVRPAGGAGSWVNLCGSPEVLERLQAAIGEAITAARRLPDPASVASLDRF